MSSQQLKKKPAERTSTTASRAGEVPQEAVEFTEEEGSNNRVAKQRYPTESGESINQVSSSVSQNEAEMGRSDAEFEGKQTIGEDEIIQDEDKHQLSVNPNQNCFDKNGSARMKRLPVDMVAKLESDPPIGQLLQGDVKFGDDALAMGGTTQECLQQGGDIKAETNAIIDHAFTRGDVELPVGADADADADADAARTARDQRKKQDQEARSRAALDELESDQKALLKGDLELGVGAHALGMPQAQMTEEERIGSERTKSDLKGDFRGHVELGVGIGIPQECVEKDPCLAGDKLSQQNYPMKEGSATHDPLNPSVQTMTGVVADDVQSLPRNSSTNFPSQADVGAIPVGGLAPTDTFSQEGDGDGDDRFSAASISNGGLVVAELATDNADEIIKIKEQENEALREELRQISANTVEAELVQSIRASLERGVAPPDFTRANGTNSRATALKRRGSLRVIASIVALVLGVVLIVFVVILTNTDDEQSLATAPPMNLSVTNSSLMPVLDTIHENGVIRCRAETVEVNKGEGFTIDLCRSLAAAVLGDPSKVDFPKISFRDQFQAITTGEVDVSTTLNTINMARDVYHQESGYGYTFSDPYYYSGTTFAGLPDFVDCVDRGESFDGICRQLVVCVISNTVTKDLVTHYIPGSSTKLVKNGQDLLQTFVDGTCNVIAGAFVEIYEERIRDLNFTGDYMFSKHGSWSSESLAMITRQSDPQWSHFSNWVLRSLVAAEYLNITQPNADNFPKTKLFGEEYQDMFRNAIAAVGNYGQMYKRHFQDRVPRQGMNLLHRGAPTGLLVAEPLGNTLIDESMHKGPLPGPVPQGTLEAIKKRGYLQCGLSEERPGFAQFHASSGSWFGLDVEFCKAVSAALFAGKVDTIVYENFEGIWSKQFTGVAHGSVDLLSGATILMRSEVNEPMTGLGYTFSHPYFFEDRGARRALLTRQDDPQWSDLIRWVIQATINAESESITQQNASLMPVVELFGPDYRQMMRDTILSVGNYAEIYNRTLQKHIPRHGWNELNSGNDPQHFPYSFAP